jgi:hypothetical protein
MGEGFIVRRGGGGQQTVKPIFNSLTSATFTSLTLNVTNDDNSIALLYYSVVQTEPGPTTPDTFETEFAGKETKDITITGLTQNTTYTVFLKAYAVGAFPSETVIITELTTPGPITATGGSITNIGNHRYHVFTGNGTFQVTSVPNATGFNSVEYVIVAGGAAGGGVSTFGGYHAGGGGGGAGGLLTNTSTSPLVISAQNYSITVGSGGAKAIGGGSSGQNSTAFSLTATGGGRGFVGGASNPALNGGSGGGAGRDDGTIGQGISGQGNNGGASSGNSAGGGGGRNANGSNSGGSVGGAGGAGINLSTYFPNWGTNSSNTTTGTRGYFSGGGGGGTGNTGSTSAIANGGVGGGSRGRRFSESTVGIDATAQTGGGGGGGCAYNSSPGTSGGSGGSGIVIIRYLVQ